MDLIRPFAYLSIKHESKVPLWFNCLVPLMITFAIVVGLFFFPGAVNFFGVQGLIDRLLGFIQTLAGFYIAALAAVSSFNSPHLDRVMPHPAPTVQIKYNKGLERVQLTRRRFLTLMFSYLTALSFLFSLLSIFVLVLAAPFSEHFPNLVVYFRWLLLFVFTFLATQLAVITFWGLFYLGERMLTPD